MNGAAAAAALAQKMKLESTRTPLAGEARVKHENASPEERAALATARLQRAEEDMQLKGYRDEARRLAHDAYIHGPRIVEAVAAAKRCLEIDETTLRAILRQAWDAGFTAGFAAGQKCNS